MLTKTVAVAALAMTFATATVAEAQSWKRINSEAEFVAALEGKVYAWGKDNAGTATLDANGTTSGKLPDGRSYAGNWVWDNKRYCRNIKFSDGGETGTACASVEMAGNKVRLRFKGRDVVMTQK